MIIDQNFTYAKQAFKVELQLTKSSVCFLYLQYSYLQFYMLALITIKFLESVPHELKFHM